MLWGLAFAGCGRSPTASPPTKSTAHTVTEATKKTEVESPDEWLHILAEKQARQHATRFVNEQLKDRKFLGPSGEEVSIVPIKADRWETILYDYRKGRIILRFGGYGGPEVTVSFGPAGENPRIEHADFAWD